MTDLPQIRVLPVPGGYVYQEIDPITLKTLRVLTEQQAEAIRSEGIAVIRIQSPTVDKYYK